MAKPLTDAECKNILLQAKEWDRNSGTTVFKDFSYIAHNELMEDYKVVEFTKYGFKELVMFGECLSLFNDRGYDQVTKLIDIVDGLNH